MGGYNSGQAKESTENLCAFQNGLQKLLQKRLWLCGLNWIVITLNVSEREGRSGEKWEEWVGVFCFFLVFYGL